MLVAVPEEDRLVLGNSGPAQLRFAVDDRPTLGRNPGRFVRQLRHEVIAGTAKSARISVSFNHGWR